MRRIFKGCKPPILNAHEQEWTAQYLNYRQFGQPRVAATRHSHEAIKSAIIEECHDKCMYCETKLSVSQPGDVEHILPKSTYPEMYISWENLGLACSKCNSAKSNNEGFVDPYAEDPKEHVSFLGPMITYRTGSMKGKLTVDGLKLNRTALLERRALAIKALMDKVELSRLAASGALKVLIQSQVEDSLSDDAEYVSTLREFYSRMYDTQS